MRLTLDELGIAEGDPERGAHVRWSEFHGRRFGAFKAETRPYRRAARKHARAQLRARVLAIPGPRGTDEED